MNICKAEEVQGILGIGNYQARTQDITDCTVCRNPKNLLTIMMSLGLIWSLVQIRQEFIKPMRSKESMEVTAEVLVCTER